MDVQWISCSDSTWMAHLSETPHDVYHLPAYVRTEAAIAGGEPVAVLIRDADNTFFLPMLVRDVPNSKLRDAASPNGYPGPLVSSPPTAPRFCRERFAVEALNVLAESMRERNIVSAFIRLHPFFTDGSVALKQCGTLVQHGSTVYIDLEQNEEELWRQTRSGHRSEIKRCQRDGFETLIDDGWEHLDDFITMYRQTMQRVSAHRDYFFPRRYFESIRDELKNHAVLCVTKLDGEVACGGIFTRCQGVVQYHLGATANAFIQEHPSKLLLDDARRWAKRTGHRKLHLGGGVQCRNDSLLQFKLGFSKLRANFHTSRLIADKRAYARLIADWESTYASTADGLSGFFPAYRKPATAQSVVRSTLRRRTTTADSHPGTRSAAVWEQEAVA